MKLIILLIALGISLPSQASLIISPVIFEGCRKDYPNNLTVGVYNQSSETIAVEVEIFNLAQNIKGLVELSPAEKPLLSPENDRFTVPAKAKVSFNFKIEDPNKPVYQAVVFKKTGPQKGIVSQGMAVLFMLALDKEAVKGKISDLGLVTSEDFQPKVLCLTVENEGLAHFKTEGVFELLDQKGARTEVVLLESGIVLPGAKREFRGEVLADISKCSLVKGEVFFNLATNSQSCNIELQLPEAFEKVQTIK